MTVSLHIDAVSGESVFVSSNGYMSTKSEMLDWINSTKNLGSYELYGDVGNNPLVIDAQGHEWYDLDFNGLKTTDDVTTWAKENGYTSVIFKDIYDYGPKSDVYAFFDSSQLKSADPITYDNEGYVIPLSERFNQDKKDIRYRISDLDGISLDETEANGLIETMKSNAVKAPMLNLSNQVWKERVQTPLGEVKMGEHQYAKIEDKNRAAEYGMSVMTLETPDIVIREDDAEFDKSHERPFSYLFVKSFINSKEKNKFYMSVTITKDGEEIQTSTHYLREKQLKEKLKNGGLVYKATALNESATSFADQTSVSGSLSSEDKDIDTSVEKQEQERKRIAVSVEAVADELGEKVRVINDVNEITDADSRTQSRMRGSKGWYDANTGEVVVVMPNAESEADVMRTVFHEVIGHKGIRELVGAKAFNKFLERVYAGMPESVRKQIVDKAKGNRYDFYEAIEEYIAEMAEGGFVERENASVWRKIVDLFKDLISQTKIAFGWKLNERDIRFMLWTAYNARKHSGAMARARVVAMQYALKVGRFDSESAIPSKDDVRYRVQKAKEPIEKMAYRTSYETRMRSGAYQSLEALFDSMQSVKEFLHDVSGKHMEDVDSFENPYIGNNLLSSVTHEECEAWRKHVMMPVINAVANLAKNAAQRETLNRYMMGKHGLERQEFMATNKLLC